MVDFIENNRDLEAIYSPNLEEIASQIGMILQRSKSKMDKTKDRYYVRFVEKTKETRLPLCKARTVMRCFSDVFLEVLVLELSTKHTLIRG